MSVYRPEAVIARTQDDQGVAALCFNLPVAPARSECNPEFAARLGELAHRLGLPADYIARFAG